MKIKIFLAGLFAYFLLVTASATAAGKPHSNTGDAGTVMGTVTDKKDGKSIIGASVNIPDLRIGTITDVNGRFTLTNLPGAFTLSK